MKAHSRFSHSHESADPLVASVQSRPFSEPQFEQPDPQTHDLSQVDLFSHTPQRGPIPTSIQPKLTVGKPNDVYEQEADRVANQVMSMPATATQQSVQREEVPEDELQTKPLATTVTPLIQREAVEAEDESLQMKPLAGSIQREAAADAEEALQAKATPAPGAQAAPPSLENQLSSSQGSGSPLPDDVRSFMEPRFGADFSQVRVHTGNDAVQMNQDLHAQAFTHKQDVYFGAGKAPANDALTAHELTHVIQQNGAIARRNRDA